MTVKQILALSAAGFSEDQIVTLAETLTDDPAPDPAPEPDPDPAPDPAPAPDPDPAPAPAPKKDDDATPEWFQKFMTKYTADYEQLAKGIRAKNIRKAGGDPGTPEKTPYELMAEAYNNIK